MATDWSQFEPVDTGASGGHPDPWADFEPVDPASLSPREANMLAAGGREMRPITRSRSFGEFMRDQKQAVGSGVASAAGGLAQFPVDAWNAGTRLLAGSAPARESMSFRPTPVNPSSGDALYIEQPEAIQKFAERTRGAADRQRDAMSLPHHAQSERFEQVEGVWPTLKFLATNPTFTATHATEVGAQMAPGGAAAKGLGISKAMQTARAQTGANITAQSGMAGSLGQDEVEAALQAMPVSELRKHEDFDRLKSMLETDDDEAVKQWLVRNNSTNAFAQSFLANLATTLAVPGGMTIEQTMMGVGRKAGTSRARNTALGFTGEAAQEGLAESAEAISQNINTYRPWDEGVAKAGTFGAVLGGMLGGPAGFMQSTAPQPPRPPLRDGDDILGGGNTADAYRSAWREAMGGDIGRSDQRTPPTDPPVPPASTVDDLLTRNTVPEQDLNPLLDADAIRAREGLAPDQPLPPTEQAPAWEDLTPVSPVEAAAAQAATSPDNARPEPTEAQKEAGNYAKGHIRVNGLNISIENPAGTQRRPEWEPLQHHYGGIRGTKGADGDLIDVFLGPRAEDPEAPVFVVDQVDPKTGIFDEAKVLLGFESEQAARDGYLANYEQGWQGLGGITQMTLAEFKDWSKRPRKSKQPLSDAVRGRDASAVAAESISSGLSDAPDQGFVESAVTDAYRPGYASDALSEPDQSVDLAKVVDVLVPRVSTDNASPPESLVDGGPTDTEPGGDLFAVRSYRDHLERFVNIPSVESAVGIEPQFAQAVRDGVSADTKLFGDSRTAELLRTKGFESLDVNRQAMVQRNMRAAIEDPQVAEAIVGLVPVDVVDMLVPSERSADGSLNNKAMLLESLLDATAFDDPVFVGRLADAVATNLPVAFASRVTEEPSRFGNVPSRPREGGAALRAVDNHASEYSTEGVDADRATPLSQDRTEPVDIESAAPTTQPGPGRRNFSLRPGARIIGNTDATVGWSLLAGNTEAFQLKSSQKKTFGDIVRDIESKHTAAPAQDLADEAGADRAWRLFTPLGKEAHVFQGGDKVWIDVSKLGAGFDGKRIYNLVANFAHNNGLTFTGDPAGLSDTAMYRRLENMLASALKFGTTGHLLPHERQTQGNTALGLPALDWRVGDDAHNIQAMLEASYAAVRHLAPEIDGMRYNPDARRFEREDGTEVTDADFQRIAETAHARESGKALERESRRVAGRGVSGTGEIAARVAADGTLGSTSGPGRTTLKRAVLTRSLLSGDGAHRSELLAFLGSQRGALRLDPTLQRILYSVARVEAPDFRHTRPEGRNFRGANHASLKSHIEAIVAKWSGDLPSVEVVATAEGLPDWVKSDPAYRLAEGFYDQRTGTVYLVAENLPGFARARQVLAHEAIGHHGIERILGPEAWAEIARDIEAMRKDPRHKALFGDIDSRYAGSSPAVMLRETVAVMAERGIGTSVIDRVIAAVKRWLADLGLTQGMTEDRIRRAIIDASRHVRRSPVEAFGVAVDGAAFSRPVDDASRVSGMIDEATNLPMNPDGTVTVYHHTTAERAEAIRRTGKLISVGEPDVYVTSHAEADTGYGDVAVPISIDPAKLRLDDEFPNGRRDFRIETGRPGGSVDIQVANSAVPDSTDQTQTPEFNRWFGDSKVVDADGKPQPVYHGSKRPDRIGSRFRASRATSGPMAFFTDDSGVASSYATSKSDTSLDHPESFAGWFKFKPKGSRSEVDIDRAWYHLTPEQRAEIAEKMPHVTNFDADGDMVETMRLGDDQEFGLASRDHWDYTIRAARGNVLKAATDIWLDSGSMFGEESKFMDVLRLGGMPMDRTRMDDPNAEFPAVIPVYLAISNPFDTANAADMLDTMQRAASRQRRAPEHGADQWDKRSVSASEWMQRLSEDVADGTTSAWTSIPDWVTNELRKAGYDGIKDTGGKYTGNWHVVWIPFSDTQVKSAAGNAGTFDPDNPNILFSRPTSKRQHTPAQLAFLTKAGLKPETRTWLERLRDRAREHAQLLIDIYKSGDARRQAIADKFHGIRAAYEASGVTDMLAMDGYLSARLSGGLPSVMEAVMLHGAPEWRDGILSVKQGTKGLLKALEPVQDGLDDWLGWMVARRAKLLKDQGRERLMSDNDIEAGLSLAKGREAAFNQAAFDYLTMKNAILDVAEQAGLIDPAARAVWDHAEYIPFYRDDGSNIGPGTRRGLDRQSSGIKTLRGGESALADPLGNIVRNFTRLMDASMKNMAMLEVQRDLPGFFEAVSPVEFTSAVVPLAQIRKHLLDSGVDKAAVDAMPKKALEGMAKLWAIQPPTADDVVRIMVDGKAQYFQVEDPLLLRSLTGFAAQTPMWFMKPMIWAKRILTAGATGTAEFVGANFMRDSLEGWMVADEQFKPMIDSIRGAVSAMQMDERTQELMMSGSYFAHGHIYGHDPDATSAALRRSLRKHGVKNADIESFIGTIARGPAWLWDRWTHIQSSVEHGTRRAMQDAALDEGKTRKQAAFVAKDLLDFSMRGDSAFIQFWTDVTPFLNARIQGAYKLGRSFHRNKRQMAMRGSTLTVATLGLLAWNLMAHGDAYDELEEWDRDTYWHIGPGTSYHIRIPKPFELGIVFGTAPERGARALLNAAGAPGGEEFAKTWQSMLHALTHTMAVEPVPQLFKPLVEQVANKNFFTGRRIESMADERKLPEARYEWWTSNTMRLAPAWASNATGMSPKRLEALWRGYTAGLGQYALSMSDFLVRRAQDDPWQPGMHVRDWPLAGRFVRGSAPPRSTSYQTEFYELKQRAEQVEGAVKEYLHNATAHNRPQDRERAQELLRDNAELLGSVSYSKRAKAQVTFGVPTYLRQVQGQLANLREMEERIAMDRELSPAEKRNRIDEIVTHRNEMLKRAVMALKGQSPQSPSTDPN